MARICFNVIYIFGRNISSIHISNNSYEGHLDLDSNVGTCVLGRNFQVFGGAGDFLLFALIPGNMNHLLYPLYMGGKHAINQVGVIKS